MFSHNIYTQMFDALHKQTKNTQIFTYVVIGYYYVRYNYTWEGNFLNQIKKQKKKTNKPNKTKPNETGEYLTIR